MPETLAVDASAHALEHKTSTCSAESVFSLRPHPSLTHLQLRAYRLTRALPVEGSSEMC